MPTKILPPTAEAYQYPLLIKTLLSTSLVYAPQQRILFRDRGGYTYREFGQRVCRLAHAWGDSAYPPATPWR